MTAPYGFSGNTTVTFEVERDNEPIELEVEAEARYVPGVTWRRPGDCYPDESEVIINSIKDPTGDEWEESELTGKEVANLYELILSAVQRNRGDYD